MADDRQKDESAMIDLAVAESAAATASTPQAANRRAHARLRAEDLTSLGARLASGAEIRLIDLSRSGAQFECDRRFLPNSTLSLRLVTPDTTFVVSGRVVRSRIVRLDSGGLGYNVAVAFNELLQNLLEEPSAAVAAGDAAPATSNPTPSLVGGSAEAPVSTALDAGEVAPDTTPISEVSPEEAAAFEATAETAPSDFTVTASVEQTGDELRDLFNGTDW